MIAVWIEMQRNIVTYKPNEQSNESHHHKHIQFIDKTFSVLLYSSESISVSIDAQNVSKESHTVLLYLLPGSYPHFDSTTFILLPPSQNPFIHASN